MESFEINLAGEILTVVYNSDESYTILKDNNRIAVIFPETNDNSETTWKSLDPVNETFVQQVSELITEHEM